MTSKGSVFNRRQRVRFRPSLTRASSQAVPAPGTKQDAGGHDDVPALWSCPVSVSELAVRACRTRDYGSPPDAAPPEYGAAPTGGFFGIGARGRGCRRGRGGGGR